MLQRPGTPEERTQRREARIARWERPIDTGRQRLDAWVNAMWVDHAFVRALYLNEHRVTDALRRSAQPLPHQIRRWAREGVKTVITVRAGRQFGSWPLEREACEDAGLVLEESILRSREAPKPEDILRLEALFRRIAYPAVLHCKSGADRAGLASALYLLLIEGADVATAKRQLSLRFGHMKGSKTGILDAVLEAYERDTREGGIGFRDWVETRYDPERITAAFKPRPISSFITDRVLDRE
ncbi:MAG: protein tyrosine phosphatase [Hyphomicrobiaceae bacterium]|nr:protein tyrosine phosphatase [Hyphomicrobiaceae bacterium]